MTIEWYGWCGYVGAALVLLAFLFLQLRWLQGHGWIYQLMNIVGAFGVVLALLFGAHNWPAFTLEALWVLIGIYGMVASRRRRQRQRGHTDV